MADSGEEASVDEASQEYTLRCPKCGSEEVNAYRMGIVRYRVRNGREVGDPIVDRHSLDPIWHACADCGFGSETDRWYGDKDDTPNTFINRTERWS